MNDEEINLYWEGEDSALELSAALRLDLRADEVRVWDAMIDNLPEKASWTVRELDRATGIGSMNRCWRALFGLQRRGLLSGLEEPD